MITMTRIQRWAIGIYLVLCPITYNNLGMPMRQWQEISYRWASMALVGLFIGNIWMAMFLWLNILLFINNGGSVGKDYIYNIFFAMLVFKVARSFFTYFKSRDELRPVMTVVILSCIWMILQLLGLDPLHIAVNPSGSVTNMAFHDPMGLFGMKAANGIYMAIAAPIFASWSVPAALLLIVPIYLCQSSVAILAYVVSLMFYLYFTHKTFEHEWIGVGFKRYFRDTQYWKIIAPILIFGAVFYIAMDKRVDTNTFNSRFSMWHAVLKFSMGNPIGWGPDSFRNTTQKKNFIFAGDEDRKNGIGRLDSQVTAPDGSTVQSFNFRYYKPGGFESEVATPKNPNIWDNPHNGLLHLLFEYGYMGIAILVGFVAELVNRFRRSFKDEEVVMATSCLIAFFVASITHFPFHLARIGYLFPVILGAYYAITDRNNAR